MLGVQEGIEGPANAEGLARTEPPGVNLAVPLGRAQRRAIERARKLGQKLRVRVRGGEIALGFPGEGLVLIENQPARRRT
jgi:broad specificity phosphatase PhoE